MWNDPIVEEIRAIRREMAKEAGYDLHRLCEEARAWERQHPERIGVPERAETASGETKESPRHSTEG